MLINCFIQSPWLPKWIEILGQQVLDCLFAAPAAWHGARHKADPQPSPIVLANYKEEVNLCTPLYLICDVVYHQCSIGGKIYEQIFHSFLSGNLDTLIFYS